MWNWRDIAGKRVFTVDVHHHVLEAWAEVRRARREREPPVLVTLDYHTDTLPAHARYIAREHQRVHARVPDAAELAAAQTPLLAALRAAVAVGDLSFVRDAITRLRYDEHIDCALRTDIVSRVFIVLGCVTPQNDAPIGTLLLPERRCCEAAVHDPACERALADALLEDATLGPTVARIEQALGARLADTRYVLDIDLDFFRTARAMAPRACAVFHALIRHAEIVTVAREAGCVGLLRLPGEDIVSADLERALYAHIAAAASKR